MPSYMRYKVVLMSYTPNKAASNKRYLDKFKTFTLRVLPDEQQHIRYAAADAGQSVQAYILQAIRKRMERDNNDKSRDD